MAQSTQPLRAPRTPVASPPRPPGRQTLACCAAACRRPVLGAARGAEGPRQRHSGKGGLGCLAAQAAPFRPARVQPPRSDHGPRGEGPAPLSPLISTLVMWPPSQAPNCHPHRDTPPSRSPLPCMPSPCAPDPVSTRARGSRLLRRGPGRRWPPPRETRGSGRGGGRGGGRPSPEERESAGTRLEVPSPLQPGSATSRQGFPAGTRAPSLRQRPTGLQLRAACAGPQLGLGRVCVPLGLTL